MRNLQVQVEFRFLVMIPVAEQYKFCDIVRCAYAPLALSHQWDNGFPSLCPSFLIFPPSYVVGLLRLCNNHYNHMTHHHNNTQSHHHSHSHNPILCNHVTLPAHIPKPICSPTHAPTLICCATFLWCTPPNTCSRLCA